MIVTERRTVSVDGVKPSVVSARVGQTHKNISDSIVNAKRNKYSRNRFNSSKNEELYRHYNDPTARHKKEDLEAAGIMGAGATASLAAVAGMMLLVRKMRKKKQLNGDQANKYEAELKKLSADYKKAKADCRAAKTDKEKASCEKKIAAIEAKIAKARTKIEKLSAKNLEPKEIKEVKEAVEERFIAEINPEIGYTERVLTDLYESTSAMMYDHYMMTEEPVEESTEDDFDFDFDFDL